MSSFGIGIYFLVVLWLITLMLCWVSVRTGHYVGKIFIGVSLVVTVVLISLPRREEVDVGANFYDRLFVLRYAILSLLLLSCIVGSAFCFVDACLTPLVTRKVKSFGIVN